MRKGEVYLCTRTIILKVTHLAEWIVILAEE
jgi:hypothetical protein